MDSLRYRHLWRTRGLERAPYGLGPASSGVNAGDSLNAQSRTARQKPIQGLQHIGILVYVALFCLLFTINAAETVKVFFSPAQLRTLDPLPVPRRKQKYNISNPSCYNKPTILRSRGMNYDERRLALESCQRDV